MRIVVEGSTSKNVFKQVARLRSEDAAMLSRGSRLLGGVYLLGYSIECYLKYAACERNEWQRLPKVIRLDDSSRDADLYTHNWPLLVHVAGLSPGFKKQPRLDALYSGLSEQWTPSLRYRSTPFIGKDGRELYSDLEQFYKTLAELVP